MIFRSIYLNRMVSKTYRQNKHTLTHISLAGLYQIIF